MSTEANPYVHSFILPNGQRCTLDFGDLHCPVQHHWQPDVHPTLRGTDMDVYRREYSIGFAKASKAYAAEAAEGSTGS